MAVVMATPSLLPTSKARLWGLHSLSKLVKVMVKGMVMVTATVTESPSTTS
jgi:hypothetical protein